MEDTFGNFSKDTEFTFDFEMKKVEDVIGNNNISLKLFEKEKLPMQI